MSKLKSKIMVKRNLAMILAITIFVAMMPIISIGAEDPFATRSEVCSMLLIAADDYNDGVKQSDIMHGDEDGNLRENDFVTRAEALVMLKRAFGNFPELRGNNLRLAIPKEDFVDIPEWAVLELDDVFNAGVVAGTGDGVFSPDDFVTVGQMKTFIKRTFTIFGTNLKDSFYATVNKQYLDASVLKEDEKRSGTLFDIMNETDNQLNDLIRQIANSPQEKGSPEEKIKNLYNSIIDMESRNNEGYKPIKESIEEIENIKDVSDLSKINDDSMLLSLFCGFHLMPDSADSDSYIIGFYTAGASQLSEVYSGNLDNTKTAYLKYIKTLLMLCGEEEAQAEKSAQDFFDFEKELSKASTISQIIDPNEMYNIYTVSDLNTLFDESIDIEKLFECSKFKNKGKILVPDVSALKHMASILNNKNIDKLKNYAKINTIKSTAQFLSQDFLDAENTFENEKDGIVKSVNIYDDAMNQVVSLLSDYVGIAYANIYCSDEIIEDITKMIYEIKDVYRERINKLDWMSPDTKKNAILKLDSMGIKVGAPKDVKTCFDDVEFDGSYFDIMGIIGSANNNQQLELEGTKVDKTAWVMKPYEVNACYYRLNNEIIFPIAFLQSPTYDKNASYEENLGGIGFVIAHEITHAFDAGGAMYDEKGNLGNWWTEEDILKFGDLCQDVIDFYDGLEAAPGIYVNPELTISENIADLGAISCITEVGSAYQKFDYKKMFESCSKVWMMTMRRGTAQELVYSDEHSPAVLRVDRVFQSVDKFYETFDINPGDGMYLEPEKRVSIW